MHSIGKTFLSTAIVIAAVAAVHAQDAPSASVNDPPGPVPDAGHIPFIPPDKVAWTGSPTGQQTVTLFGDPSKPGMYGVLIKWNPGAFSKPHFHDQERYIYVVSGTWWVSSSSHYDPKNTFPMPAGSVVKDVANTIHYDGARTGGPPAVLELVGMGPVKTIPVGEDGKPLPPRSGSN
jgi:quercetin dioxygenase-like cupin family protein